MKIIDAEKGEAYKNGDLWTVRDLVFWGAMVMIGFDVWYIRDEEMEKYYWEEKEEEELVEALDIEDVISFIEEFKTDYWQSFKDGNTFWKMLNKQLKKRF